MNRKALSTFLLGTATLFACTPGSNSIGIETGLAMLKDCQASLEKNVFVPSHCELTINNSVYKELDEEKSIVSVETRKFVYDLSNGYSLTYSYQPAIGTSLNQSITRNGANYYVEEGGTLRDFDNSKDSYLAGFLDLPAYFVSSTKSFVNPTYDYLNLVDQKSNNPLTSYGLSSLWSGQLSAVIRGKILNYDALFASCEADWTGSLILCKGSYNNNLITAAKGTYATLDQLGNSRYGISEMAFSYRT